MGRKYRELKQALLQNSSRGLLVIDDVALRKEKFATARRIMKKIDRLEGAIAGFHARDLSLFKEWSDLTFRRDHEEIEDLRAEFTRLARFHNDLIGLTRLQDMNPFDAYQALKEEERRWSEGDERIRSEIEAERKRRRNFIEEEMRREFEEEADEPSQVDWDGDEDEDDEQLQDLREAVAEFRAQSDEEARLLLRSPLIAVDLLLDLINWASLSGEAQPALRAWDLTMPSMRKMVSKLFESETGFRLSDVIAELHKMAAEGKPSREESAAHEDFVNPGSASSSSHRLGESDEQRMKRVYRDLVRRLHPDLQVGPARTATAWMKGMWERVQQAHRAKDLQGLEKLLRLTLLRGEFLNELSLDEIAQSAAWLEDDFARLEGEARSLKRSPAWKFSTRKDFGPIERRIRKELQEDLEEARERVLDLKEQHELFASLRPRGRRAGAKKTAKRRRNR